MARDPQRPETARSAFDTPSSTPSTRGRRRHRPSIRRPDRRGPTTRPAARLPERGADCPARSRPSPATQPAPSCVGTRSSGTSTGVQRRRSRRMTVGPVGVPASGPASTSQLQRPEDVRRRRRAEPLPALATDACGHVYMAWIDATNFALYYAFSNEGGKRGRAAVEGERGGAVTNEFRLAAAGGARPARWPARVVLDRQGPRSSDSMPSSLTSTSTRDAATQYQWFGYAALISKGDAARRRLLRPASLPSRCTTAPSATRARSRGPTHRRPHDGRLLRPQPRRRTGPAHRLQRHDQRAGRRRASFTRQIAGSSEDWGRAVSDKGNNESRRPDAPTTPPTSRTTRRAGPAENAAARPETSVKCSNLSPTRPLRCR